MQKYTSCSVDGRLTVEVTCVFSDFGRPLVVVVVFLVAIVFSHRLLTCCFPSWYPEPCSYWLVQVELIKDKVEYLVVPSHGVAFKAFLDVLIFGSVTWS